MKIVTALLNPDDTLATVRHLTENGFTYEDLSLMSTASDIPDYLAGEPEESAATGAVVGAAVGGTLGALGTGVASTIPGFEGVFVSGLMTTAVGSVVGGYLGSLYTVRADEQTEMDIHEALESGKILIIVKCNIESDVETAVSLLEESGCQHIETHTIANEDA